MKRFQKGVSVLLAILVMLSSVAAWSVFAEGGFALTAVDGTAGNSGEGLDKLFDGKGSFCLDLLWLQRRGKLDGVRQPFRRELCAKKL